MTDGAGYRWQGTDRHGNHQRGHMLAANPAQVRVNLHQQGINATRVTASKAPTRARTRRLPGPGSRIRARDLDLLTQQTASMIKAGLPLLQALNIVAAGTENQRARQLLQALHERVATGASFSDALAEHPQYFNRLFISMITIGEQSGTVDTALQRVAACQQRDAAIIRQVKKAMVYPLTVLCTAAIVTAVLLVKVVPQFAATFADLGAPLPGLTQSVLTLSDIVIRYGWLWLLSFIVGGLCCIHLIRKRAGVRLLCHRLLLRTPALGLLLRNAALAHICRTLATTIAAGLTIVEALQLSATAAGNLVYQQTCLDVLYDVEQGQSLGFSIRKTGLFPVMITQLTNAGEESGTLDTMLEKCADHYEDSVNDLLDGLTGLLEPAIMATLGLLVGGLMVAMYLPIFRLGAAL
ncbi:type II secretion system F family protein [Pseudohongiella sp.]|uniref:Type II secretion system protein GspF domain-containing protein n=1 Tax=marine sediment metagenome TaxID=412755 RepID=A0A0F9YLE0_9ZZZZ|nr:type II secretion system F family protein [Pseudohongiella sp.]HDZ10401.1 type II secretion system F family protein [Pseudohongiella sp.]HEA61976.1 type II secretion system F family protein [Pseudohongiella sp.]